MKRELIVFLAAVTVSAVMMTGCGQSESGSSSETKAFVQVTTVSETQTDTGAVQQFDADVKKTESSVREKSLSGGWAVQAEAAPIVSKEQKDEFVKSKGSFDTLDMEPVALLGEDADGAGYAYLCLDKTVDENPVSTWDVAVTQRNADGNLKLNSIIEIHPENIKTVESSGEELTGSWKTASIKEGAVLEDELKAALDSVIKKEYVPIAVLGTQIVSGTNYILLIQEQVDGKPVNYVIKLYVDLQGNAELTEEAIFDLDNYLSIDS